ncbi:hypothetical protein ACHAXS_008060 [Conticribra weissflogii]
MYDSEHNSNEKRDPSGVVALPASSHSQSSTTTHPHQNEGKTMMDLGEDRDFRELPFSARNEDDHGHVAKAAASAADDMNIRVVGNDDDEKNNPFGGPNQWIGIGREDHCFGEHPIENTASAVSSANTAATMGMDQFGKMTFTLTSSQIACKNNNNNKKGHLDDYFSSSNFCNSHLSSKPVTSKATNPFIHDRNIENDGQDDFINRRRNSEFSQRPELQQNHDENWQERQQVTQQRNSRRDEEGYKNDEAILKKIDSEAMRCNVNKNVKTILPDCARSDINTSVDFNSNSSNSKNNSGGNKNVKTGRKTFNARDLMKLTADHALRSKFPPGCSVIYDYQHDKNIGEYGNGTPKMSIGKVNEVFIDMLSRELVHSISSGIDE